MLRTMFGIFLLLVMTCASQGAVERAPLQDGKYVTSENGHLSYDGERLKLWGVNFCAKIHHTADLELTFDRIAFSGFNAVRLNHTWKIVLGRPSATSYIVPKTVVGSNSQIDLLDKCIYLAKQRGMFFWHGFGMSKKFTPADYDALKDDGSRDEWNEMIKQAGIDFLVYVDDRSEKVLNKYAENFLNHVNPYTGRRWADEEAIGLYEVFNEDGFIDELLAHEFDGVLGKRIQARWNDWLARKYGSDAKLKASWGALSDGELLSSKSVKFAPLMNCKATDLGAAQWDYIADEKTGSSYSKARSEDVMRFAYDTYTGLQTRFIKHLRSQGKPGVGVSVVPIAFTGRYGQSLACYYGASQGDFVSVGNYGFSVRPKGANMPGSVDVDDPNYPHIVRVNRPMTMETPNDVTRVKGKPYLVYETNDYKPNPYTIEFAFRTAVNAVWNDMDGVFWFYWDDPGYLKKLNSDADYVNSAVQMPDPNHASASLIFCNDEVALMAMKTAGAIFCDSRLPSAASPVTAVIGRDILLNLKSHTLNSILESLRLSDWQSGLELVYDVNRETELPKPAKVDLDKGVFKSGKYITFDWRNKKGKIRIDSPTVKMQVGFNGKQVAFDGGVKFSGISGGSGPDHDFSSVALVAVDGKAFADSGDVLLTLASTSEPTGFVFDIKRMKKSWAAGIGQATARRGKAPMIVSRVAATVKADWLKGRWYQKFDFGRSCYEQGLIAGDSIEIKSDEPMFFVKILAEKPEARFKKILVIGNSISNHGPRKDIDWKGSWGMAATSQGNDYVHQVLAKICKAQPQLKPVVKITRPQDESKMIGGEKYLEFSPDLVIIEVGDNYRGKANVEELQKPYEKIISDLKDKCNPVIYCLGTWGNPQFDVFIKKAAESQNVTYVNIGHLAGKPENRAQSEGHFTHGGVNWHPGDRGMKVIAGALWDKMKVEFITATER